MQFESSHVVRILHSGAADRGAHVRHEDTCTQPPSQKVSRECQQLPIRRLSRIEPFQLLLQAATQVNEASISYVSKLLVISATFIVLGSWTLRQLVDYTSRTIASITEVTR